MEKGLKGLKNGNGENEKGISVFQGRERRRFQRFTSLRATKTCTPCASGYCPLEAFLKQEKDMLTANSKTGHHMKKVKSEL